jgi:hypothetical protein
MSGVPLAADVSAKLEAQLLVVGVAVHGFEELEPPMVFVCRVEGYWLLPTVLVNITIINGERKLRLWQICIIRIYIT